MKDFKLLEHNLIPLSLFVLNLSVVHFIYLVFRQELFTLPAMLVFILTMLLIMGVIKKNKMLMMPSAVLYTAVLVLSL